MNWFARMRLGWAMAAYYRARDERDLAYAFADTLERVTCGRLTALNERAAARYRRVRALLDLRAP